MNLTRMSSRKHQVNMLPLVCNDAVAILGQGEERGALVALSERLGVGDRVRLLGSVPHDEVARFCASSSSGVPGRT